MNEETFYVTYDLNLFMQDRELAYEHARGLYIAQVAREENRLPILEELAQDNMIIHAHQVGPTILCNHVAEMQCPTIQCQPNGLAQDEL